MKRENQIFRCRIRGYFLLKIKKLSHQYEPKVFKFINNWICSNSSQNSPTAIVSLWLIRKSFSRVERQGITPNQPSYVIPAIEQPELSASCALLSRYSPIRSLLLPPFTLPGFYYLHKLNWASWKGAPDWASLFLLLLLRAPRFPLVEEEEWQASPTVPPLLPLPHSKSCQRIPLPSPLPQPVRQPAASPVAFQVRSIHLCPAPSSPFS